MVSVDGIMSWALKAIVNPIIWLFIIIGIILAIWLMLVIRKKKKMRYPAMEIVDLGNGKTSLNVLRCGWIGRKIYLKGLWWSGREVMRTNTMEEILEFSEEDYQEVNGKRGVVFYRDPIGRTLVPIARLKVTNKELVADIPPAEFVDASINIVRDAERETTDWKEKIVMVALIGGIVIFALVSIIFIVQMIKNSQEKANALIIDAGKICLENAKTICSEISSAIGKGGNAP